MKKLFLPFVLIFITQCFIVQNICSLKEPTDFIHVNNVKAAINNKGNNCNYKQKAYLKVPFSGANTPSMIYEIDLWFTAIDAKGNKKYKFLTFKNPNLCGYIPGPWFEGTDQEQYDLAEK
ncbi:MAG TPA: hypothetical protein ENK75_02555 [Saprospiraceae bacterium]|nr:hypothetical protein [Saprospiraceae bacterium]